MNSLKLFTLAGLTLLIGLSLKCKEEGCTDPSALNFKPDANKDCCCEYLETGTLKFNITHLLQGEDLELNKLVTNDDGRDFTISLIQYYFSSLKLISGSDTFKLDKDLHFFFNHETTEFTLENIPVGNYTHINFDIGVEESINDTKTPDDFELGHPLYAKNFPLKSMYWGAQKYLFLRLEGDVDTSFAGNGDPKNGLLVYHIGTNPTRENVHLALNGAIQSETTTTKTLKFDYGKLLEGMNLNEEFYTQSTESDISYAHKFIGHSNNAITIE